MVTSGADDVSWDLMLALLQTQPDLHLATRDSGLLPEASPALG